MESLKPKSDYVYVKIETNLINNSDAEINFKLDKLKVINDASKELNLLYRATFDDGKKSYTVHNINPPKVMPQSKSQIELLAIAEDNCPKLTLQYQDRNPVSVELTSIPVTSLGQKTVKQPEEVTILSRRLGPFFLKFKGENHTVYTIYLTESMPGGKNENLLLSFAYFDNLPAKVQEYARKNGFNSGDMVAFNLLGRKKGGEMRAEMLLREKKE